MGSDFNGDGFDDILWRTSDGTVSTWNGTSSGAFVDSPSGFSLVVPTHWWIGALGDFDGDGRDDILWQDNSGTVTNWHGTAGGGFINNPGNSAVTLPSGWFVTGTGDFNGDGRDDVLWRGPDGTVATWRGTADGGFISNIGTSTATVPWDWSIQRTGDFNGDGRDDVLWRHSSGLVTNWLGTADGGFINNHAASATMVPNDWWIAGRGDFDGDGRDDVLWQHNQIVIDWLGTATGGFVNNHLRSVVTLPQDTWVVTTGDFNGDGRDDLALRSWDSITNWLGTGNGGFAPNDTLASRLVPTDGWVQPEENHLGWWWW